MRRPLALLACCAVLLPASLLVSGCGDDTKTVTATNATGQTTTRTVPDVLAAELGGVTALAETRGVDVKALPVPSLGT